MASSAAQLAWRPSLFAALHLEAGECVRTRLPPRRPIQAEPSEELRTYEGPYSLVIALNLDATPRPDNTRQAEPSEESRPRGAGPLYSSKAGRVQSHSRKCKGQTMVQKPDDGAKAFEEAQRPGPKRQLIGIPRLAKSFEEAHRSYIEEDGRDFLTHHIKTNLSSEDSEVMNYMCTLCKKEATASHLDGSKHKKRLEQFCAERNERAMKDRARQSHIDDGPPGDHGHCQPAGWAASGASVTDTRRVQYYYSLLRGVSNRSL